MRAAAGEARMEGNPLALGQGSRRASSGRGRTGRRQAPECGHLCPFPTPASGSAHRVGERRLSPEWGGCQGYSGFLYFGRRKLNSVITFGVSPFPVSQ